MDDVQHGGIDAACEVAASRELAVDEDALRTERRLDALPARREKGTGEAAHQRRPQDVAQIIVADEPHHGHAALHER